MARIAMFLAFAESRDVFACINRVVIHITEYNYLFQDNK